MDTPTPYANMPPQGSPERRWWRQGAMDEAHYQVEGMTPDGKEFFSFVKVLAQQGDSPWEMTRYIVAVYGSTQPWKGRLKLIWELLKP